MAVLIGFVGPHCCSHYWSVLYRLAVRRSNGASSDHTNWSRSLPIPEQRSPATFWIRTGNPKEIYHAEYYADAQPLEGFSFSSPPVFVVLKNGPFHRWGMEHPGQQPPDRIRDTTIAYARGGRLLISMLVITDPRLQTKEGVSVGADYADVQAMYPHAIITPLPSLWEEPTCALREQGLTFFFKRV